MAVRGGGRRIVRQTYEARSSVKEVLAEVGEEFSLDHLCRVDPPITMAVGRWAHRLREKGNLAVRRARKARGPLLGEAAGLPNGKDAA